MQLSKRSFEKESELLNKDIKYTCSQPREFGSPGGSEKLGKLGKIIIGKFIQENQERERLFSQKEKDLILNRRNRNSLDLNKWKFNSHQNGEFEKLKIDENIFIRKSPKPKYLIKSPFKNPKIEGDYFAQIKA